MDPAQGILQAVRQRLMPEELLEVAALTERPHDDAEAAAVAVVLEALHQPRHPRLRWQVLGEAKVGDLHLKHLLVVAVFATQDLKQANKLLTLNTPLQRTIGCSRL